MLGQLDRNQLMGLLANLSGGSGAGAAAAGGSGAPATAAASGAGGGGVELEALQSILQGLGGAVPGASAPSSNQPKPASAQPAPPSVTDLNLQHVLDASEISSAAQASAEEFVKRLSEHLPPLPEGAPMLVLPSSLQHAVALTSGGLLHGVAPGESLHGWGSQWPLFWMSPGTHTETYISM